MRRLACLCAVAGLTCLPACYSTRSTARGAQAVREITDDMRRAERIRSNSAPSEAQEVMGREPDAVQKEGQYEVHYYFIRGGTEGEALRLLYRENRLTDRQFVRTVDKK